MECEYKIGGEEHVVTAEKRGAAYVVSVNGRELAVDLAAVEPGSYSLLVGGEAAEVIVVRDGSKRYVALGGHTVILDEGGELIVCHRVAADVEGWQIQGVLRPLFVTVGLLGILPAAHQEGAGGHLYPQDVG